MLCLTAVCCAWQQSSGWAATQQVGSAFEEAGLTLPVRCRRCCAALVLVVRCSKATDGQQAGSRRAAMQQAGGAFEKAGLIPPGS